MKDNKDDNTDNKWFLKEEIQDLAKFGGSFLKKTVSTGLDAIKEAKENLTQEAINNISSFTVDKFFSALRQHRLDISIKLHHVGEENSDDKGTGAGSSSDKGTSRKNTIKVTHGPKKDDSKFTKSE